MRKCGLLLQMSDVAWSPYLSVCWAHWWSTQKRQKRSLARSKRQTCMDTKTSALGLVINRCTEEASRRRQRCRSRPWSQSGTKPLLWLTDRVVVKGVRMILDRGSTPHCRLRRRKFWKFDYEMVHSEIYLNKYVVCVAPFSTHACPDCSQNIKR